MQPFERYFSREIQTKCVCVGVCVSAYVSVVKSEVGRMRLGYSYIARNRVRRASERI